MKRNPLKPSSFSGFLKLVGVPGFEPGASWTRRADLNLFRVFCTVLTISTQFASSSDLLDHPVSMCSEAVCGMFCGQKRAPNPCRCFYHTCGGHFTHCGHRPPGLDENSKPACPRCNPSTNIIPYNLVYLKFAPQKTKRWNYLFCIISNTL